MNAETTDEVLEGFPLSPQQRHIWRLQREDPEVPYRAECTLRVRGALEADRLADILKSVVRRHEILRTTYRSLPALDLPLQVVHADLPPALVQRSLAGLGPVEQAAALRELASRLLEDPFDLAAGPVLRAALATVSSTEAVLLLSLPALCADAPSLLELAHDIAVACSEPAGAPGSHSEPMQYADIAAWQNALLESEETVQGRERWQRHAVAESGPGGLSFEIRDGAFTPERLRVRIDRVLAGDLAALTRREGAAAGAALLAGWALLLQRRTGGSRVTVSCACDGRKLEELAGAVGLLVRHPPVEIAVEAGGSFRDLVRATAREMAGAVAYQEYFSPREAIPYGFELLELPAGQRAGGAIFEVEEAWACTDRFVARLAGLQRRESLTLQLAYDAGRLDAAEAGQLLAQLITLLREAVARPAAALAELDGLGEVERHQVVREANDTAVAFTGPECLHGIIVEGARRTPGAVAASFEGEALSYRELDERSNRLARHLRRLGAGPGSRIAICVERSLDLLVGLLGILKSGSAYVPLDPAYPLERLAYMLEGSGPPVLVTQQPLLSRLPRQAARIVCLDTDRAALAEESSAPLQAEGRPDDLAYLIYTSGSSGRPKGVMVSHRAILNRLLWMRAEHPLAPGDRVLHKTPVSFDASIWEIFCPWLSGAEVVVARPGGHQDGEYLVEVIRQREVTVLQLVPSLLRVFLQQPSVSGCTSLRRLFAGGEALPSDLARRCAQLLGASLCNLYGPTECSIDATSWVCGGAWPGPTVPIGRALSNLNVHVVDADLAPLPAGAMGEVALGGAGLAWGYLGRPDLTAERFVPSPFEPGERLYRTGDLARRRVDGALEFLGRSDQQVKVRGIRIEPGEIEAVLSEHSAVRSAAVVVREDRDGELRLVAYVVPAQEPWPVPRELRSHLAERLPEPMVPSVVVLLEALPLTPNGKLDRGALPSPPERAAARSSPAAPRSMTEEVLAEVWADVLGLTALGIHDDFFELGGHSLLATQLISRLRHTLRTEVSMRQLFDAPTVAGLARSIESMQRGAAAPAPALAPVPRDRALALSFGQERLWFIDQLVPGNPAYNLASAFRLEGPLRIQVLARCLEEIVRRHEALRTTFAEAEEGPVQVVASASSLGLPLIDLSGLEEGRRSAEADRLASAVVQLPFDLAQGPLCRLLLLRLRPAEHFVTAVLHHIVSDGWSMMVMVQEVAALYEAFSAGRPSPLPELPLQYADFAAWQRSWMRGEVLEEQLAYWRRQLRDVPPFLDLPTDLPRPAVQTFAGRKEPLVGVPPELCARLRAISRGEGASLFMTALAALACLLQRYCGQPDILVGVPSANRNHLEIERLIGFFVNTLVIRTDLAGEPTFAGLLSRVRDVTLEASRHQDLPFEKLVEELQPQRDLSRQPLFQVMFLFQNVPLQPIELAELTLAPGTVDNGSAMFDLRLELGERPEGLAGLFEYNLRLFDATTVARLARRLEALLHEIARDPDQPVSELPVLAPAERHQILVEWNDTAASGPGEERLHELFETQAERAPEAVAVLCGERSLTYGELDRQANRLAHRLRSLGVTRGSWVAVDLCRSLEMVPALLGILKAGGAYVPLDVSFPASRVQWVLSSLGVRVAITDGAELDRLRGLAMELPALEHLVRVDGEEDSLGETLVPPLPPVTDADDLAYVIFTSGSTGTPKGVVVRHRPVVNLIRWFNRAFGIGDTDRILFVTSLTFDLSVYDLFGLLAAGGSIEVATDEDVRDPERLVDLLVTRPVTCWDSAPAALQQLGPFLPDPRHAAGSRLRRVFLSGDWIPVALPDRVREVFRGAEVVSLGGATEATVWSNYFPIGRVDPQWASIPYGRPIANASYHVLDAGLRPLPVGVVGDLYIGGACLASGYAGEPGLTAAKFIPDPFGRAAGGRLYRTGDRARYRADGNLEFLGRLDQQVKIRGFRIELGEVEAVLGGHPGVREVVVVVRDDPERRLVAYVVAGEGPAPGELRRYLEERLPQYMVPSAFVLLDALPLTPNGKLDRRALPDPGASPAGRAAALVPPRSSTERVLAEIWVELLGLDRVGIRDDFFELGGHSLLATQLAVRIRKHFSVQVPLREIFAAATVEALAQRVEEEILAVSGDAEIEELLALLDGIEEEEAERLAAFSGEIPALRPEAGPPRMAGEQE